MDCFHPDTVGECIEKAGLGDTTGVGEATVLSTVGVVAPSACASAGVPVFRPKREVDDRLR